MGPSGLSLPPLPLSPPKGAPLLPVHRRVPGQQADLHRHGARAGRRPAGAAAQGRARDDREARRARGARRGGEALEGAGDARRGRPARWRSRRRADSEGKGAMRHSQSPQTPLTQPAPPRPAPPRPAAPPGRRARAHVARAHARRRHHPPRHQAGEPLRLPRARHHARRLWARAVRARGEAHLARWHARCAARHVQAAGGPRGTRQAGRVQQPASPPRAPRRPHRGGWCSCRRQPLLQCLPAAHPRPGPAPPPPPPPAHRPPAAPQSTCRPRSCGCRRLT
jgi:hypothetical protein